MVGTGHTVRAVGALVGAAALVAACETPGAPPIGGDEGDGPIAGAPCSINPRSADFAAYQIDRQAFAQAVDAPSTAGVIVKVTDGNEQAFQTFIAGARIMGADGQSAPVTIEPRSGGLFLVRSADDDAMIALIEAQGELIEYVGVNSLLFTNQLEPNDPCYAIQWHYWPRSRTDGSSRVAPGGIDLPSRWERTTGSDEIVVAVLDTGFAANPDNSTVNVVPGYDFISNAFIAGDGDGRDADETDPGDSFDSFHGTHVAGTVGSASTDNGFEIAGGAWNVSVQNVRVLGLLGGELGDIIDAIRWSAGLSVPGVPDNPTPARVINMSLGGGGACPIFVQDAIDDATAAGALVVAAAGNDGADAARFTPAGCDNVLTVAAADFNGVLTDYSNFGDTVEILAPGGDTRQDANRDGVGDGVISTLRNGLGNYNGTSMASPHVAAVAALILSEDPTLSPSAVQSIITNTALPRTAAQCPRACGAGLLNATPAPES